MALDQKYFDDINIDVVKKKYYNANKVNAVLEDIREQALRLEEENRNLREQLESLSSRKEEIGDAILSAKTVSQQIISDACVQSEKLLNDSRLKAKQIIAAAQEKKEHLLAEAAERQEYCVRQAEKLYSGMRERQLESIEIKPEVVDPEDVDMLQDLILTAVNGALKSCDDQTNAAMAKLQGGLGGFPGLF